MRALQVRNRTLFRVRRAFTWALVNLPPQIAYVLWVNKNRVTRQPSVPAERVRRAKDIDKDFAIALWQADADRLNGLAAKGGAVLAGDALVAAGLVTQTDSSGWVLAMVGVCGAYLISGAVAACLVQRPMQRQTVGPMRVLDGDVERRMIEAVVGNEVLSMSTQNLVSVAVRDTFIALMALIVVLAFNLWM